MTKNQKNNKGKSVAADPLPPLSPTHPSQPSSSSFAEKLRAPPPAAAQGKEKPKPTPNHGWPEKLKVSHSGTRVSLQPLEGVEPKVEDGILRIPPSIVKEACRLWENCLFGWFYGSKMPFFAVKSVAMRAWKDYGLEDVSCMLEEGLFEYVFRFRDTDGLNSVLERGPWTFGSKTLFLMRYDPGRDIDPYSRVPVWIRLHQVPLTVWHPDGLNYVSSVVGRPLALDPATSDRTRLTYARVLVELDAAKAPPREISILAPHWRRPREIKVQYEWKPARCPDCCQFGHFCTSDSDSSTDASSEDEQVSYTASQPLQLPAPVASDPPPLATPIPQSGTERGEPAPIVSQLATTGRQTTSVEQVRLTASQTDQSTPGAPLRGKLVHTSSRRATRTPDTCPPAVLDSARGSPSDPIASVERDQDAILGITPCVLNRQMSPFSDGSRFTPLHTVEECQTHSDSPPSSSDPPFTPVKGRGWKKKGKA